jgi:crotonobetainyl-CoA:carnitine CoA-transferase CaiB-like acyl-CoA transferase
MTEDALEGITILDFTQMIQGPRATQKLADLGAEVLKIESRNEGDWSRSLGVMNALLDDNSPFFYPLNKNKKSITLDLKSDEGRQICLELGEEADVVVNNFRPGVMGRLGLEYEDFERVNSSIIYCEATGYGSTGPYADADKPGHDVILQAMGGLADITGRADDPPTPVGTYVLDKHAGSLLTHAIMVALFHKERTGEGQLVETNLLNAAMDLQYEEITTFLNMDVETDRSKSGIAHLWGQAPMGIYPTTDGHFAIVWADPDELAEVLEIPGSFDYSMEDLFEKRDEIKEKIEKATKELSTEELSNRLDQINDAWCGPVQSYQDLVEDEQVKHNDMITSMPRPEADEIEMPGQPVKFSKTPGKIHRPAPDLGEHTEEILDRLGRSDEIADLKERNVI